MRLPATVGPGPIRWGIWGWWALATLAGFTAVGYAFHFPGEWHASTATPVLPALLGATSGAAVGALQWLVLRTQVAGSGRWVVATGVGFALVHPLADALPILTIAVPFGLMGGALVGGLQWAFFRRFIPAGVWVGATAVSWAVGLAVGVMLVKATGLMALPAGRVLQHTVVSVITGGITGIVNGYLLARLVERSERP